MVLTTNDKYALPLPLTVPILVEEPTRANKVSKVLIPKIVKPKKPASKIDQLTKELQKLSILFVT
jgi:hypothetical protein